MTSSSKWPIGSLSKAVLGDARQPEVDFLNPWVLVFPKYGQIISMRVKTLIRSNLVRSSVLK